MTLDASGVAALHDGSDQELLRDYLFGNHRVEAAIQHALRFIPPSARRILDIGCGIGWSSREFARRFPRAQITAVDRSPLLIQLAQRLTLERNVRYAVQDVRDGASQPAETFDVIVMLDIYQQIPAEQRGQLHRTLSRSLAERGVVILTCPSPEHQRHLRQQEPDRLQAAGEDVDEAAAATAACDVGGRLLTFERVQTWQPNDSTQIVIARPGADVGDGTTADVPLTPPANRARLVEQQLGLVALGNGLIAPVRSGPLVCVATPELDAVSETFIRNHITALPMPVCVLQGRPIARDEHDRPILRWRWRDQPGRMIRKALRTLKQPTGAASLDLDRALAAHLRRRAVAVVLAEYGVTAVEVLDACRLARVPLVVHFHGYDAYARAILNGVGRRYRELLAYAQAIVVVSGHMREQILGLGAPPEKVHVIPCGVDIHLFAEADPAAAPPRFLAVGRFVEKKAPHLLVVAMSHAVRDCPDARLTMVGTGPLLEPCRQLAKALHVDHAITFTGARGQDAVARHMREARAFVQHSITTPEGDREGTPVSILEAMLSGLPVIATRHGGIVECVADGNTGLLVDEQDVEGMADQMVRLARDPREAARLGRAARVFALERFPLDRRLDQLAAVLRAAIDNSDVRRRGG